MICHARSRFCEGLRDGICGHYYLGHKSSVRLCTWEQYSLSYREELFADQIVVLSLVLLFAVICHALGLVVDIHDHEECLQVFSSTGRT